MTNDTITKSIRVLIRPSHDGLWAHSPDLPGLNVWGRDDDELDSRVIDGVRFLYRMNWGTEVTVVLSADPATRLPVRTPTFSEYTLARAA